MLAFNQAPSSWRRLIIILATATTVAVMGVSSASSAPKVVAPEPIVSWPHSQTAVRFFTINQILAGHDGRLATRQSVQLASIDSVETSHDNSAPFARQVERTGEPFNLYTFRAPEGLLWTKWRNLQSELVRDAEVISDCRSDPNQCPSPAALRLLSLVDQVRPMPRHVAIAIINRSINLSIRYVSDMTQHGVPDLWSAPIATLTSGQGDCEDYAIAKYEAMRQLGIAADDLRILLVRDRAVGQDHAVLSVQYGGRWNVLDNRHSYVVDTTDVPQFLPLFSINHAGVKLFAASYAGFWPDPSNDIAPASPAGVED